MNSLVFRRKGSKFLAAKKYPTPLHETIVEPFAGGAGYSLHYDKRSVLLDIDPIVASIWDFALYGDTESLPRFEIGDDIRQHQYAHPGAYELIKSRLYPGRGANICTARWTESIRAKCIATCESIRSQGWEFFQATYENAPDIEATWFVDPPYQHNAAANSTYRGAPDPIDYKRLADWVMSRKGQVIVCEGPGADWLPFETLGFFQSAVREPGRARRTEEKIFYKVLR